MGVPRRRVVLGVGAAALAGPAIRPRDAAAQGVTAAEILVGQNITLQGGKNAYGREVMQGIEAALGATDRAGGVNGRRIRLVTLDDDNKATEAEANARRLVERGVFVLFGSIEGGPSTAVAKVATEAGVPFIGPMAGSPGLRRPHQPMVFPVRAEHRDEFNALIQHGRSLGLRKLALFHSDSGVGREHLANVEKLAAEAGLQVGTGLAFKSDINDEGLAALLASGQREAVDLVFNHGSPGLYGRLVRLAAARRQAGERVPTFWGVNSGSSPLAAELGPLAYGMVFTQIVPSPWAGKAAVVREYRERLAALQPAPSPSYGSLEGYVTARALVAALRAAGPAPSRTSLLAALQRFELDLGGFRLRWQTGEHTGSRFVDLALVGRDGRFVQ